MRMRVSTLQCAMGFGGGFMLDEELLALENMEPVRLDILGRFSLYQTSWVYVAEDENGLHISTLDGHMARCLDE